MFECSEFKRQAREQLRGYWKTPILITLPSLLILLVIMLPLIIDTIFFAPFRPEGEFSLSQVISVVILVFSSVIFEIAILKYYLIFTEKREKATVSAFLEALNLWRRGISAALWEMLWIFLWTMLFIIPGMIKAIAYSQMLFIVAEYPHISVRKAMKISVVMTKGYKADLFIYYLSFFGWQLLATLSLGLGYVWLIPYMGTAYAYTYRYLKADALRRGVLTDEDFGIPAAKKDVL